MLDRIKIEDLLKIAKDAGEAILEVYNSEDFSVEIKSDNSPLTRADNDAHKVIVKALQELYPEIPLMSEEGISIPYDSRKDWEYYWCIDPLDGTKEFIKRNDEFTVNIALIHRNRPVLGIIFAPVLDTYFYGTKGKGSFRIQNGKTEKMPEPKNDSTVNVVASRSHLTDETAEYIDTIKSKYEKVEVLSAGSSLKLCLVAEGKADVYPRFAPTSEWDTAAGQIIVEEANAKVLNAITGVPMVYNKENILNPWFIVISNDFQL